MIGAIAGDVIGSVYERYPIKTKQFPLFQTGSRFTDDTVLSVAIAHAILTGLDYQTSLQDFGRRYPNAGYGGAFINWIFSPEPKPYNSWGNGSAMRVSPIGFAFDRIELVLRESAQSAQVSHNHPEGIKGAQATALAVFFARTGYDKESIRKELSVRFNYCLSHRVDEIRPRYHFDVSCQGTVPQAIVAFLDSTDFEDAIRNAISLGGDSDTLGCITGGIAHAYYWEIPKYIVSEVRNRLPEQFLQTIDEFEEQFMTL